MPELTEATTGVFNWIDLMSPDMDSSTEFYTEVFGWTAEDQYDTDGETRIYVMFEKDGRTVAGLGGQPGPMQGAPPMWNSYIAVDDAGATTAEVERAGGQVLMPPMPIGDSGTMAIYAAPDGAVVSVWQPDEHIGATLVNEDGAWSWNELMTRGLDAAKPFYEQVFGWTYEATDGGPTGTYWVAMVDDRQMAGLMAMPPGVPDAAPNHWGVYFTVADIDGAVARIEKAGGTLVGRTHAPGVGPIAMAHDPLGASFSLMQPDGASED